MVQANTPSRLIDRSDIESPIDREIAQLMDASMMGELYGPRVAKAYSRALGGGFSGNEELNREMDRAEEEEAFLLTVVAIYG